MINRFESNNTKFHKSLLAETEKFGGLKCVGVQDRTLKLCYGLRLFKLLLFIPRKKYTVCSNNLRPFKVNFQNHKVMPYNFNAVIK